MRAVVLIAISSFGERIEAGEVVDIEDPGTYARLYRDGAIESVDAHEAKEVARKTAEDARAKAQETADKAIADAEEKARKAAESAQEKAEAADPGKRNTITRLGPSGRGGMTVTRVDPGIRKVPGEKGGAPQEDTSTPGQQRPGSGEPPFPSPENVTTVDPSVSHDAAHRGQSTTEVEKRRGR